jgi:hypothetical protein
VQKHSVSFQVLCLSALKVPPGIPSHAALLFMYDLWLRCFQHFNQFRFQSAFSFRATGAMEKFK